MNVLIVGLGSMGKRRARLIQGLQAGYRIVGVDNSIDRCKEAEGLGITAYNSIPEALEQETIGAAFVCTAPLTHAIIIDQLLDQGLSVFTELNLVSDGYEDLCAKAEEKGLTLFMSSTMLYRAETEYITDAVQKFGKPVNYIYHIGQYLPDWHPWENYKDFFVGDARTGGVREILAIDLPWLLTAFGGVQDVTVMKNKISDLEIAYPDSYFITLQHSSGTIGMLATDVVSPKAVRNFEVFGEGLHLFWEGNPKSLYAYNTQTKNKDVIDTYTECEQDPRYSDNVVENAYVDEIINFFEVLDGKAEPKWSFTQDLEVIHLIEKIEGPNEGRLPNEPLEDDEAVQEEEEA